MKKREFRRRQKQRLLDFAHTAAKKEEDKLLLQRVLTSDLLQPCHTVGVTISLPLEVDTSGLIHYLWQKGKRVYLAKAHSDQAHSQDFVRYEPTSSLKKSHFGVYEVASKGAEINNNLDLLFVPGLAFAAESHARLGFGGGYYDRFLAQHPNTKTVALVNSMMFYRQACWPVEKTDVPVETIITKEKIYH